MLFLHRQDPFRNLPRRRILAIKPGDDLAVALDRDALRDPIEVVPFIPQNAHTLGRERLVEDTADLPGV